CPPACLLNLVYHEDAIPFSRHDSCSVPLLPDPLRTTKRRFIGTGEAYRHLRFGNDLPDQGGLPHLTRARHYLNEPARFAKAPCERRSGRSCVVFHELLNTLSTFTHHVEYFA